MLALSSSIFCLDIRSNVCYFISFSNPDFFVYVIDKREGFHRWIQSSSGTWEGVDGWISRAEFGRL